MSNGMKITITIIVLLILMKHPEVITQILNALQKAING